MKLHKHSPPVIGRTQWRLSWLAALAMAMPLSAYAAEGANEPALDVLADTIISAEALAAAHAKGLERQVPRVSDDLGVILWDEGGRVRRTNNAQAPGLDNDQAVSASLSTSNGNGWSAALPSGFGAISGGTAGIVGRSSNDLANAVSGTITGLMPR